MEPKLRHEWKRKKDEMGREEGVKEEDSFPGTLLKVSALAREKNQLPKYNHKESC